MATVTLDATGATVLPRGATLLPRRVLLTRHAVERLALVTGTPLPWGRGRPASGGPGAGDVIDADTELRRRGLMADDGALFPELPPALAVLGAPEALVDLDLSVRHPGGHAQVRSWHRLRDGRVTTLSTAGGPVELAWFDDHRWQGELARAVTVAAPVVPPGDLPHDLPRHLPHELLLGTGEALRLGREDVFAEILGRHPGADAGQVRRLHTGNLGRLRVVVSGTGDAPRRIGWLSWVLYADGWRALSPYVGTGDGPPDGPGGSTPRVRVDPVDPLDLGVQVARLVTRVRA